MKRNDKHYRVNDLLKAMSEHGLPSSRMWLRTAEMQKRIVCPRLPNSRADRVFTASQINEIVKAFSPGGKGQWKYE